MIVEGEQVTSVGSRASRALTFSLQTESPLLLLRPLKERKERGEDGSEADLP